MKAWSNTLVGAVLGAAVTGAAMTYQVEIVSPVGLIPFATSRPDQIFRLIPRGLPGLGPGEYLALYTVPAGKTLILTQAGLPGGGGNGNSAYAYFDFPGDGERPLGWWSDDLNVIPLSPETPLVGPAGTILYAKNTSTSQGTGIPDGRFWFYGYLLDG